MIEQETGGPAFPAANVIINGVDEKDGVQAFGPGMTLRDYFAAKAMHGILSDANAVDEDTGKKISLPEDSEGVAIVSYMMADAMIKARKAE